MNRELLIIGTVLLVFAVIPATGIVFDFRRVDWRSSSLGRVLHSKSVALATVLWLSIVSVGLLLLGFGRPWWFEVLRTGAFGYVAVVLWRQWRAYRAILRDATRHATADDAVERDKLSS